MSRPLRIKRQPSIRRRLFISIATLILLVTLAELGLTYYRAARTVDRLSRELFDQTAARVDSEMRHLFEPVEGQLRLVRSWAAAGLFDSTDAAELNRVFIPMLEAYPQIAAVTAATEHGAEYLLIRSEDGWINRMTPPIDEGGPLENTGGPSALIWWDKSGMNMVSQETRKVDYDSRQRPWWSGAILSRRLELGMDKAEATIHWTDPYVFFTSDELGISTSLAFDAPGLGLVVTALHLPMSDVTAYMSTLQPSKHGTAILYTEVEPMGGDPASIGNVLAKRNALLTSMSNEIGLPGLASSANARRALARVHLEPFQFRNGGETWWADFRPFDLTPEKRFWTGIFVPESDLAVTTTRQFLMILAMALSALALALLVAARVSARVSEPLQALVAQSGRIARMDLAPMPAISTRYREMNQVSHAMEDMREALALQMQAREHTAEELRRSETKYRNLIETSNDIVWSMDRDGKLTYLNQAAEGVFGERTAALLGRRFIDLGECRDRESDEIALDRMLEGEAVRGHESERLLSDGSRITLLINATPLKDDRGRVVGATGTAADISELKAAERTLTQTLFKESTYSQKLEEEVLRRTQELREKSSALEQTVRELRETQDRMVVQEKLASLGALTAGIAHEIKNPLNFINNFAGLNLELTKELHDTFERVRDALPADSRGEIEEVLHFLSENAQKIHKHGKQADSIVQGMLTHSRGRKGEFQATDLNAMVEEHMKLAYHGMRARETAFNAAMEHDLDPGLGEVHAIPQDLGRVLLNVINNACYAVYEKRRKLGTAYQPIIRATTRGLDDCVEIRIRDNGTGMPAAVAEKVFNPFFTTKPAGQGTGLGMSIAFDIIAREHGGSISVDTREGEYTELLISLPRGPERTHG